MKTTLDDRHFFVVKNIMGDVVTSWPYWTWPWGTSIIK